MNTETTSFPETALTVDDITSLAAPTLVAYTVTQYLHSQEFNTFCDQNFEEFF
jgi:hypothetical protein